MPKQEYKILEFHGGTNAKFDARDIADNQNASSQLSIANPGRLTGEGAALSLYDKTYGFLDVSMNSAKKIKYQAFIIV